MNEPQPPQKELPKAMITDRQPNPVTQKRFGLILAIIGVFIFIFGAEPDWFGLDRSPVTGFVQIAVFLVGLGFICLGGYLSLASLWKKQEMTIIADIGMRLVSTGYVVAVVSGMADVFGFGSEAFPRIPTFGVWQLRGVLFGQVIIGAGFLFLIPWKKTQEDSFRNEEKTPLSE